MSATDQKIGWAKRAVDEMRAAQRNASRDDFQYHFGAFLGFLGALRQFITVPPHEKAVYNMDVGDLSYCVCIDLRNEDVYVHNVAGSPRSVINARFEEHMSTQAAMSAVVKRSGRDDQEIPPEDAGAVSKGVAEKGPSPQDTTSVTGVFYIDPTALRSGFAVVRGEERPEKPSEKALLQGTAAVDIAETALAHFQSVVLPKAIQIGILIP